MATLTVHHTIHNMIEKAFSTHPCPWTAYTNSAESGFASEIIENEF
jgi:hypothetical protein